MSFLHFLYRFVYIGMFFLYLPKLCYEWLTGRKTGNWFHCRFFPKSLERKEDGSFCVWVHAVSVGEVLAVEPIVRGLLKKKKIHLILSTVTMTGMETIRKRLPEIKEAIFLPFDFACVIRRLFRKASPQLVLLSEGDIWPEFLMQAKRKGASVGIVNAKLSDRSYRRMTKLKAVGRWLLSYIDLICAQNDLYAKRFQKLMGAQTTLLVTGNTKGDTSKSSVSDVNELKSKLHLDHDFVLTIASSHHPEEQKLLEALLPLLEKHSSVRVIVVPRHPHRFESVYELITKMNLGPVKRYSSLQVNDSWKVLLVDQMGLLERMYSVSTVAFICGSFVDSVGGHNIIEAAQWGVPCIVGPYMHAQKSLMDVAVRFQAVVQVSSYEQASDVIERLFGDDAERKALSHASLCLAEHVQGASKRCLEAIDRYFVQ